MWILAVELPSAPALFLAAGWPCLARSLFLVAVQALWIAALPLPLERFPLPAAGSPLAVGLPSKGWWYPRQWCHSSRRRQCPPWGRWHPSWPQCWCPPGGGVAPPGEVISLCVAVVPLEVVALLAVVASLRTAAMELLLVGAEAPVPAISA